MPNHFTSIDAHGLCYQHVYVLKIDMSMYVCMCICMCVCLSSLLMSCSQVGVGVVALDGRRSFGILHLLITLHLHPRAVACTCMYVCMYVRTLILSPLLYFYESLVSMAKISHQTIPPFRSIYLVTYMSIVS